MIFQGRKCFVKQIFIYFFSFYRFIFISNQLQWIIIFLRKGVLIFEDLQTMITHDDVKPSFKILNWFFWELSQYFQTYLLHGILRMFQVPEVFHGYTE